MVNNRYKKCQFNQENNKMELSNYFSYPVLFHNKIIMFIYIKIMLFKLHAKLTSADG